MAFDIGNLNQSENDYVSGLGNLNYYGAPGGAPKSSGTSLGNSNAFLSSALQAFQGLTMLNSGTQLIKQGADFTAGVYRDSGKAAVQGANFSAAVYRQAGQAALIAGNYDIAVDQLQTSRQQDVLGRQLTDSISSNYVKAASNGLSLTSKSTLMVQNDILTTAERTFAQTTNDAKQRQSLITYNAQLTNMQYENEARATEYAGQVAKQQAENQARNAEYQGEVSVYQQEQQKAQTVGASFGKLFQSFGGQ